MIRVRVNTFEGRTGRGVGGVCMLHIRREYPICKVLKIQYRTVCDLSPVVCVCFFQFSVSSGGVITRVLWHSTCSAQEATGRVRGGGWGGSCVAPPFGRRWLAIYNLILVASTATSLGKVQGVVPGVVQPLAACSTTSSCRHVCLTTRLFLGIPPKRPDLRYP